MDGGILNRYRCNTGVGKTDSTEGVYRMFSVNGLRVIKGPGMSKKTAFMITAAAAIWYEFA